MTITLNLPAQVEARVEAEAADVTPLPRLGTVTRT